MSTPGLIRVSNAELAVSLFPLGYSSYSDRHALRRAAYVLSRRGFSLNVTLKLHKPTG